MSISEEFRRISGIILRPRATNLLGGRTERMDGLFNDLTYLFFLQPAKFKKLQTKVKKWAKDATSETILAAAGYIFYIARDSSNAKKCFLKALSRNPDNLDNWMDLAFALRHTNEYAVSDGILFNFDHVMFYYAKFGLKGCCYKKLKSLILEIRSQVSGRRGEERDR